MKKICLFLFLLGTFINANAMCLENINDGIHFLKSGNDFGASEAVINKEEKLSHVVCYMIDDKGDYVIGRYNTSLGKHRFDQIRVTQVFDTRSVWPTEQLINSTSLYIDMRVYAPDDHAWIRCNTVDMYGKTKLLFSSKLTNNKR